MSARSSCWSHSPYPRVARGLEVLVCALLLVGSGTAQTVYYVDASGGDDSNTGTSESDPWQTIEQVNAASLVPGDQVLFKRGELWREILVVPASGSVGSPITFAAYGSGPRPRITCTQDIGGSPETFDLYEDYVAENADFEVWTGGLPAPWEVVAGGTGSLSEEADPAHVQHGARAARLEKDGSNSLVAYNYMEYRAGMRYTVRFFAKGAVGGEGIGIRKRYFDGSTRWDCQTDLDADGFHDRWSTSVTQSETYTLTARYQEYEYRFQAGVQGGAQLRFELNTANSQVWIDNVRAYPEWTPHARLADVYGLHWYGGAYGSKVWNEFRMAGARLHVVDLGPAWSIANNTRAHFSDHDIGYSSKKYVFWLRDDSGSPRDTRELIEAAGDPHSVLASARSNLVLRDLDVFGACADDDRSIPIGALVLDGCRQVLVKDCIVSLARAHALSARNCREFTFRGNEVHQSGGWGLNASIDSCAGLITNNTVHDCGNAKQDDNDGHGIGMHTADHTWVIYNDLYANGAGGSLTDPVDGYMKQALTLHDCTDCFIGYNNVHDNYRGGIDISGSCSDIVVAYNLVHGNGLGPPSSRGSKHSGIQVTINQVTTDTPKTSRRHRIFNNVVAGNDFQNGGALDGAIYFLSGKNCVLEDVQVFNNITFANVGGYELSRQTFDGGTIISADLDHNLYYRPGETDIIKWTGGVQDWATYHVTNGNEPSSLSLDPLFSDATSGDYRVDSTSPAWETGTFVGIFRDYAGTWVPQRLLPEMGAFEVPHGAPGQRRPCRSR